MKTLNVASGNSLELEQISAMLNTGKYDFVIRSGSGGNTSIWVFHQKHVEALYTSRVFTEVAPQIKGIAQFIATPSKATYAEVLEMLGKHFVGAKIEDAG